jgi:hypothetical protein
MDDETGSPVRDLYHPDLYAIPPPVILLTFPSVFLTHSPQALCDVGTSISGESLRAHNRGRLGKVPLTLFEPQRPFLAIRLSIHFHAHVLNAVPWR